MNFSGLYDGHRGDSVETTAREHSSGRAAHHAPGRMGVGIISAGKVGAAVGSALRAAGHQIIGAYARSAGARERLETLLPGVPALDISTIVERSELVILAIPTAAIEPLVAQLAQRGAWQAGQIVVHTAGRVGTAVLAPAARAGALCLAIHPAMSFTGTSLDTARLASCTCAVTAPAALQPIGHALVAEMGGESVVVAEADRPAYHLAIKHGAQHVGTVIQQAMQVLAEIGIEHPGDVLRPLVESSVQRVLNRSQEDVLHAAARSTVAARSTAPQLGSDGDTGVAESGGADASAQDSASVQNSALVEAPDPYLEIAAELEREDPNLAGVARAYRVLHRG
ncbi:MAG: DUF2520 domain-containing protein [Arcanobacterium sp.]|nr:DUF2520 domain-containing protein [Arcanobacterium sp.]